MPAIVCPYCSALTNFTQIHVWERTINIGGQGRTVRFAAWYCNACDQPIVGRVNDWGEPSDYHPKSVVSADFPDVPEAIARDARSAHRCLSIEEWRASAAMARRAIQASAFEMGAPDKKLADQLEWLAEHDHISKKLSSLATEIRLGGNVGAHPDKDGLEDVDESRARALLDFLDNFLAYAYQIPAHLDRVRSSSAATEPT